MPKIGTNNALFGYFQARILQKLLSYLKSAPSNLSNRKIFAKKKTKMPQFGTRNALFGYFWAILAVLGNFKKLFNLGKPIDSY